MSRLLHQVRQVRQARQLHRVTLEVERKFKPSPNFIRRLEANRGTPAFHSIRPLPQRTMEDIYFDHRGQLARNGLWVRMRNGAWQAKVRRGGDFVQSSFEEYGDVREIRGFVGKYLHGQDNSNKDKRGHEGHDNRKDKIDISGPNFGLTKTAHFTTYRRSWLVNDTFNIVHDETSFGHCVGEVELEREMELELEVEVDDYNTAQTNSNPINPITPNVQKTNRRKQIQKLQQKKAITQMNEDLSTFLTNHAWAFQAHSEGESESGSESEEDQRPVPVGKLSAYFARFGYDNGVGVGVGVGGAR